MPGNANFDAIATTTIDNYIPKMIDNIWTARPLQAWLLSKGRIESRPGGRKIVEPMFYATNSTAGSYSGYDTVTLTAQTGITAAEYNWRQYAASIAISGVEERQNDREWEVLSLLEAKIKQAEEAIKEGVNTLFYSDGTGNSNKDFLGLKALVGSDATSPTSVGGIDSATEAYWRSYVEATAAALTLAYMSTAYNTASIGVDQPDFAITTQTLYEKYESLLQPQQRLTNPKTAEAGFQNLLWRGATVMFDTSCTAGYFYMLNSKYLRFVYHPDAWFKRTEWVRPENMDAKYALILLQGNLITSSRRTQAVLRAKTA